MERPRWYSQKFYEDLKCFPKALEFNQAELKQTEKENFSKKCIKIFNRRVNEEVFQKEVNFEIMAVLAKE